MGIGFIFIYGIGTNALNTRQKVTVVFSNKYHFYF